MRPTHKSVYIVLIDSTETETETDRRRQSNRVKLHRVAPPRKQRDQKPQAEETAAVQKKKDLRTLPT
jgi:hypothetical protein